MVEINSAAAKERRHFVEVGCPAATRGGSVSATLVWQVTHSIVYLLALPLVAVRATTSVEFGTTVYASGPGCEALIVSRAFVCIYEEKGTKSMISRNQTSTEQDSNPPGGDAAELWMSSDTAVARQQGEGQMV